MNKNRAPLKILVITHEYPPIGGGGGQVVRDLCEGIASDQYRFHVLTAHFENLPTTERKPNLTIERLRSRRTEAYRAGLVAMGCFVWKSFWRALKMIKEWQPDLIHAHFAVPGGAAAALAGIITKTPYLFTAHGGDIPGGTPEKTGTWFRYILPFTRFIWKRAESRIAVSEASKTLAERHYPVEIDVIPNGIRTDEYRPEEVTVGHPPHIMYIGRFSPEKNAVMVPRILARVKGLPWRCTMLGDGLQMQEIRDLLRDFEIEGRVSLPGWVSPDQVKTHLKSIDILLMPSFREGMPISGLQALASGAALVMTDIGACGDMVDVGKNGFLVKAGDEKSYADALKTLLESREKLLAFKKFSLVKADNFDFGGIFRAYKDIYHHAAKRKG